VLRALTCLKNQIEILPLSPNDNRIRRAEFRAIYPGLRSTSCKTEGHFVRVATRCPPFSSAQRRGPPGGLFSNPLGSDPFVDLMGRMNPPDPATGPDGDLCKGNGHDVLR
jgi:hypothetical protein